MATAPDRAKVVLGSIRTRFSAIFVVTLAFSAVISVLALNEVRQARRASEAFVLVGVKRLAIAKSLETNLYLAQIDEDRFLTRADVKDLESFRSRVDLIVAEGARLAAMVDDADQRASIEAQVADTTTYAGLVAQTADVTLGKREVEDPAVFRALVGRKKKALEDAKESAQRTLAWAIASGPTFANRVSASFERLWAWTAAMALGVIAGGAIAWRSGGRIVKDVGGMAETIRTITGDGDLARRLPVTSSDEIGMLARDFNSLLDEQAVLSRERDEAARREKERADATEVAYRELHDATEALKRSQQKLMEADKLSAIGRLAAGVAHEINNPGAAVRMNLDILRTMQAGVLEILAVAHPIALEHATPETRRMLEEAPEARDLAETRASMREAVDDAIEGMKRIAAIVDDLRTFSRKSDEIGPVDVNAALETSLKMATHEIKNRADIVKELGAMPAVTGNRGRLQQVFLNLLVNSAQSIPAGRQGMEVRVRSRVVGDRAIIEVSDTGSGIPEEHRARIFDPFFTTKPVGQGTGLGLSISHEIVRQLGGEMSFETEVGRGTTFTISLPLAAR